MVKQRSDGTTLVAIYHFISAFLSVLGMCGAAAMPLFMGLMPVTTRSDYRGDGAGLLVLLALCGGALLFFMTIANIVVGIGLLRQKEWARISALVLAVFRLLNIPLGTIIGGFIIWHLLRAEVKEEFAH